MPGVSVLPVHGSILILPILSRVKRSFIKSVFGICPISTKIPVTFNSSVSPPVTFFIKSPSTNFSPFTSKISIFFNTLNFGFLRSFSTVIASARKVSLRFISVTELQYARS